ncbi:MAG: nucleotidyltransferase domain-containing protein [Candidatus Methanomethylicaceae archaeon]
MKFDIYIEEGLKALKAMEKHMEIVKKIKEIALSRVPDAKVYLFGSIIEGKYTAASDIDVLIITSISKEKAYELKALIYKEIDAPIQLHIANPSQLQWYTKFINKMIEV